MSRVPRFTAALVPERFYERAYAPGDETAVMEVELECFRDAWPLSFFVSETIAEGRYHRLLIEANSERVAAYLLSAWQYLDLHILNIGVRREFRRKGLATKLMLQAAEELLKQGGESIILELRESNDPAYQLYLSLGFEEIGRREGYYSDGENAVVMQMHAEKWVSDAETR